jgi:putative serine protease PepD
VLGSAPIASLRQNWAVALVSGLVGALVAAGLTIAVGGVLKGTTVYKPTSIISPETLTSSAVDRTSPAQGPAIVNAVLPSLVALKVTGANGVQTGSGVVFRTQGKIAYVLSDAALFATAGAPANIEVISTNSVVEEGALIGTDPSSGVAVIRVAMSPVQPAILGTVASVELGDGVFAIGSPTFASNDSFGTGTVNASDYYVGPVDGTSTALFGMLATTAVVAPAAFGGALVNAQGQVVGITNPVSLALDDSSVSYATPIDVAVAEATSLIETGQPSPHAWLGVIGAADVPDPTAQQLSINGGVQVAMEVPGSPAAAAGIQEDDVITSINGQGITSTGAFMAIMATAKPGIAMQLAWVHQGKPRQGTVHLGVQPTSVPAD